MEIQLTHGKVALIDDEDAAAVNDGPKWQAAKNGRTWYASRCRSRSGVRSTELMHRIIAGAKRGEVVDHINCDGLDNRAVNLRICTVGQNTMAQRKTSRAGNSSKFKGVYFNKQQARWMASIKANGVRVYLGYHDTQEAAAMAYDTAARAHYGEWATLNFPLAGEVSAHAHHKPSTEIDKRTARHAPMGTRSNGDSDD